MAHHRYQVSAFVLGTSELGESGKQYLLISKELGLIVATASGVRSSHSKMRYSLQKHSGAEISLVRGRGVWRVVGAVPGKHLWIDLKKDFKKKQLLERFVNLIRRLVPRDIKHEEVYGLFEKWSSELVLSSEENLFALELVGVVKLLSYLGYFPNVEKYRSIVDENTPFDKAVGEVSLFEKDLVVTINNALQQSHL